jgi:hypothetical protein
MLIALCFLSSLCAGCSIALPAPAPLAIIVQSIEFVLCCCCCCWPPDPPFPLSRRPPSPALMSSVVAASSSSTVRRLSWCAQRSDADRHSLAVAQHAHASMERPRMERSSWIRAVRRGDWTSSGSSRRTMQASRAIALLRICNLRRQRVRMEQVASSSSAQSTSDPMASTPPASPSSCYSMSGRIAFWVDRWAWSGIRILAADALSPDLVLTRFFVLFCFRRV